MEILKIRNKLTGKWASIPAIKGDKGEKGDKGDKGDKGESGPVGPTGPAGTDGANGHSPVITIIDGIWYIDGVSTGIEAVGPQGPIGPKGDTGPQGEPGTPAPTYTAGTNITISADNVISATGGSELPVYPTDNGNYNLAVEINNGISTLKWIAITTVWQLPTKISNNLKLFQCATINKMNNKLEVF